MTEVDHDLLKALHSSLCVRFGTTAPYSLGRTLAERVGFACDPCVAISVHCRPEDVPALVPIVRQHVYGELAERGWSPEDIEFTPMVQQRRTRIFVDENESSQSLGKRKRGAEHRFTFRMHRQLAAETFVGGGTFKTLPEKEDA